MNETMPPRSALRLKHHTACRRSHVGFLQSQQHVALLRSNELQLGLGGDKSLPGRVETGIGAVMRIRGVVQFHFGVDALGRQGTRAIKRFQGLANGNLGINNLCFGLGDGCVGLGTLRFDLSQLDFQRGFVEARENIALLDHIALIGIELQNKQTGDIGSNSHLLTGHDCTSHGERCDHFVDAGRDDIDDRRLGFVRLLTAFSSANPLVAVDDDKAQGREPGKSELFCCSGSLENPG